MTSAPVIRASTIHACVNASSGSVRLLLSPTDVCRQGEQALSWNTEGPAGPPGPPGSPGPTGAQGIPGPAGTARAYALVHVTGPFGGEHTEFVAAKTYTFAGVNSPSPGVFCLTPSPGIDPLTSPAVVSMVEPEDARRVKFIYLYDRNIGTPVFDCPANEYEVHITGSEVLGGVVQGPQADFEETAFNIMVP